MTVNQRGVGDVVENRPETQPERVAPGRRPYEAPRLESLGSVSDLTAGAGPNPGDDTPTVGSVTAK